MTNAEVTLVILGLIYVALVYFVGLYGHDLRNGKGSLSRDERAGARVMLMAPIWPIGLLILIVHSIIWLIMEPIADLFKDAFGKD
jgi:hypothetical protein